MKKIWILFSLVFLTGGLFAQLPIILESELQKLKAEAASNSSNNQRGFRARGRVFTENNQTETEEQQTDEVVTTPSISNKSNTPAKEAIANKENGTSNSSQSDYIKKYRERQKRIKNNK